MGKSDIMSTKIMTPKQFDATLSRVLKTRDRIKADIHAMCVYALVHVVEHGNTTALNWVAEASEGIVHNNGVRQWFNKVGKGIVKFDASLEFKLRDGSQAKGGFALNTELRNAIVEDEAKCSAMIDHVVNADPYYVQTKLTQKDPDFLLINQLMGLVKKTETRMNGDKRKDTDDFTGFDELRVLVERLAKRNKIIEGGVLEAADTKVVARVTSH